MVSRTERNFLTNTENQLIHNVGMNEHLNLGRGEIYEPGHRLDDDLAVIDHIGGTRKVDIYRCKSNALKKQVACKILRPEYCIHFKSLQSITKEGEMLARMDHPNVMRGYSFALEPAPRIVMDYVGGQDLKSAFFSGNYSAFPITESISIARQLAAALDYVHSKGILHLDVKPSNVLYSNGSAVLIDFSVSREFDPDDLPKDNAGTRDWMAPEQLDRTFVGPYTDVFGLGVVFYQLLAKGRLPYSPIERMAFAADDIIVKVPNFDKTPRHPSEINETVNHEIGDIALKAINPLIEDRYSTPAELGAAIAKAESH